MPCTSRSTLNATVRGRTPLVRRGSLSQRQQLISNRESRVCRLHSPRFETAQERHPSSSLPLPVRPTRVSGGTSGEHGHDGLQITRCQVQDQGQGIPPDQQRLIFEGKQLEYEDTVGLQHPEGKARCTSCRFCEMTRRSLSRR